jgi:H+/Cl- antiporter ClcA
MKINLGSAYQSKLAAIFESVVAGFIIGLIVAPFRFLVTESQWIRQWLYTMLGNSAWYRTLLLVAAFIIVAIALGFIARLYPMIKGSGIPQVEGVIKGKLRFDWKRELPLKWLTSIAGVSCGMSLGREGPLILIGAYAGDAVSRLGRRSEEERRMMITVAAAAGMSAAFGAPLAGVIFAIEELHAALTPLFLSCCMGATITASVVTAQVLGVRTAFSLPPTPVFPYTLIPQEIILGIIIGFIGHLFKLSLYGAGNLYERLKIPPAFQPVLPMLLAIVLGFTLFDSTGGGHSLIEDLTHAGQPIWHMMVLLAVKLLFTALCFGSGVSGGIFLPFLSIGALTGQIYYQVVAYIPHIVPVGGHMSFIIFGMAAMFAAVVNAPVTGAVLIFEMCGNFNQLVFLVIASLSAYLCVLILHSKPVYEVLLENILKERRP